MRKSPGAAATTIALTLQIRCGGSAPVVVTPPADRTPPVVADPVGGVESPDESAPCELDGIYRFRFLSNGHPGWWFRFRVHERSATVLEPIGVLAVESGPVSLRRDLDACTITVSTQSRAVGTLTLALTLESPTRFVGELTRTQAHDPLEKRIAIRGVRDVGPPPPGATCIVPGTYALSLDPKVAWANADPHDRGECDSAPTMASPIFVRVEPFGETLAVTLRDYEPPHGEAWALDELTRDGECAAAVTLSDNMTKLSARLEFGGDEITGNATEVIHQIVEDGTAGEHLWECVGHDVPLVGVRL